MATVFCHCGTAWLTQLMNATLPVTTYFIGWGEGVVTANKSHTALLSEVQSRIVAPSSIAAFNQIQWISTLTATAVRSISNAGLFHTQSGTLLIFGDFSTIPLAQNDRIEFTVTLTST